MKKQDRSVYKSLAMISQFGINMIVPIAMSSVLGYYLDKLFGTNFIMIILFFVGALAGFRNIYLMAKEIYGDDSNRKRKH